MSNQIDKIVRECNAFNEAIGAGPREKDRVKMDAVHIDWVRNQGITVETLAMMLTDAMFAVKKYRELAERRGDSLTKVLDWAEGTIKTRSLGFEMDCAAGGILQAIREQYSLVKPAQSAASADKAVER